MTKKKRSNLSDVRRSNCRFIFDLLYEHKTAENEAATEGMTLLEIEQHTGLSRPTVVGMVRAMEEAGLVARLGKRESNGGRTPFLYGIRAEAGYAIGVDFEFPACRTVISDLRGRIVAYLKREYPKTATAEEVVEYLQQQIEDCIEQADIKRTDLLGIGIGIPGYINLKTGIAVRFDRISDWQELKLIERLSEATELPVFMENDVHLLFRAEQEKQECEQDTLFIAIRSGIGSAILQKGHIVEGEYGNAGYIGHTVINVDGPECTCGNHGCLELYASENAVCHSYTALTGQAAVQISEIVEKAKQGETAAQEVLKQAGRYLGVGIGNAVNMLDMDQIILSSYFDSEMIRFSAQKVIDQMINQPQHRNVQIIRSVLNERQFALGGCQLVFNRSKEKILSAVSLKNI